MDQFTYFLPTPLSKRKILKKLPASTPYTISIERGERCTAMLLDTFDEELFHQAKLLLQTADTLLVVDLQTGYFVEQPARQEWVFAHDLEEGPVTTLLADISMLRAFLPVEEVTVSFERGLLLDDEGKTRARLNNLAFGLGKKSVSVGYTQYLRGYGQAHDDLQRALEKVGARKCAEAQELYKCLNINRRNYNSKPLVKLDAGAPARESGRAVIETYIRTARRNEYGVIADFDTEFLHDFRVSLRKVRSVLSLFKGAFSPEDTLSLKSDFASLMQKTNLLRDLDVYLLNREKYFRLVPADTHEGLVVLFDYFAGLRTREHKVVSKFLKSKRYQKEIKRLGKRFDAGERLDGGPRGEENSLDFARRLVLKRYGKVCKIARSIDEQTEDELVHDLRINCKKLRYLMEFFAPLFDAEEMKTLIKSLKVLQDNLGKFNDYSVQRIFLRQVLKEKMDGSAGPGKFAGLEVKIAEGVGALTAMLNRLQKKERRQVMKNFARFDSPETRDRVTRLFATKEASDENSSLLQ